LKSYINDVTLNQRVPGSSPGAPTSNLLQIRGNPKQRWETRTHAVFFGKLMGMRPAPDVNNAFKAVDVASL
jgi:hypothetical protein